MEQKPNGGCAMLLFAEITQTMDAFWVTGNWELGLVTVGLCILAIIFIFRAIENDGSKVLALMFTLPAFMMICLTVGSIVLYNYLPRGG